MVIGTLCTLAFILTAYAPSSAAPAAKVADFYKGKTVKLVLGFDPGNTSDTWARIIAPYLEKQIGATVVVAIKEAAVDSSRAMGFLNWQSRMD